jgi:Flp pilus assembly protein TadD
MKTTFSAPLMLALLSSLLLGGCGGLTLKTAAGPSATRQLPPPSAKSTPAPARTAESTAAEGLKLARLLRDQGRHEGAAQVYAQLEHNGQLQPLQLLEFASVAARVQPPADSLALYGRARRAIETAGIALPAAARATLCSGMGRARMAIGQHDAAFADFDCALAAEPDNTLALNAKGVLLDARGEHAQAQQLLRRANQLEPADPRVLNNLALSYLASGDSARAIALLSQISQADSARWPSLQLNLAFAQAWHNDEAAARQTLSQQLPAERIEQALAEFAACRQRIHAGSSMAEELLAASRRLLPLTESAARHG